MAIETQRFKVSSRYLTIAAERLCLFDAATKRQKEREEQNPVVSSVTERGWTRPELYVRGDG